MRVASCLRGRRGSPSPTALVDLDAPRLAPARRRGDRPPPRSAAHVGSAGAHGQRARRRRRSRRRPRGRRRRLHDETRRPARARRARISCPPAAAAPRLRPRLGPSGTRRAAHRPRRARGHLRRPRHCDDEGRVRPPGPARRTPRPRLQPRRALEPGLGLRRQAPTTRLPSRLPHVAELRNKLRADLIESVRGIGYRGRRRARSDVLPPDTLPSPDTSLDRAAHPLASNAAIVHAACEWGRSRLHP